MAEHSAQRGFRWQAFTSIAMTVAFATAALSGIILYVSPQCGVARHLGWAPLGLLKDRWAELHMNASFLFLALAIYHLVLNWKLLLSYLKRKVNSGLKYPRELAAAVGLSGMMIFGTVLGMAPFGTVPEISETLKAGWAKQTSGPVSCDSEVAQPAAEPRGEHSGAGYGQMTIAELCRREGVDLGQALAALAAAGATATADETPKTLADRFGGVPHDYATVVIKAK